MKFTRLALFMLAACLVAAPLLIATADSASASGPAPLAGAIQGTALASAAPAACGAAAPAGQLPVFQSLPFFESPQGCFSCHVHSDCRSFCGGDGACFPDRTYTCSLSRYDKFCIC